MFGEILHGIAAINLIFSCYLVGAQHVYEVDRTSFGDIIHNCHGDSTNIGAEFIGNGTCICSQNGTFYYEQQFFCLSENSHSTTSNWITLNEIRSVPLVSWSDDDVWKIVGNKLHFPNSTQITIGYCHHLDIVAVSKMENDHWVDYSQAIFFLQKNSNSYSLKLNNTDYVGHEGQLYNLEMICHKDGDAEEMLSLLIKFSGSNTYRSDNPTHVTSSVTSTTSRPTTMSRFSPTTSTDVSMSITSTTITNSSGSDNKALVIGASVAGGCLFVAIVCVLMYCCCWKRSKKSEAPSINSHSLTIQNNNGQSYVTPNNWLNVETPPPVPDSPRPNQRHNYEYPDAGAYVEFSGSVNEPYEALQIDPTAEQTYHGLSSNKETNGLYEPLNDHSKPYNDIYTGLNENQTS